MGSWSWLVGDLRTGRVTSTLPVIDGSWSQVMDDAGTLSVTIALSDEDVAALNPRVVAEPCRCFLAVAYNDEQGTEWLIDGGPIWTHSYDLGTRQLQIGAAGLWSYWDHRFVLPVLTATQTPAKVAVTYSQLSLGTVAAQLVALAQSHTGGSVPVVVPAGQSGTSTRTYAGSGMVVVGQALRDLTQVINGPEIQFTPRRNPADGRFLQWVMRAGTTVQPLLTQSGADHVWDLTAVRSSAAGAQVTLDGTGMTGRAWVQGAGTDTTTLFGRADNPALLTAGFPLLESLDSDHSGDAGASLPDTLASYAQGDVAAGAVLAETWTLTVERDDQPTVTDYQIGDWCVIMLPTDDPYLTTPLVRGRVTGKSGDMGTTVTLQIQPELA